MKIWKLSLILLPFLFISPVFAEELKVLESQLNKNSITGVVQNPYNYTLDRFDIRAEFYDKDGHLVGLRDFGYVTEDDLKPNEQSGFKIWEDAGETTEFPKTDFIVKAEGLKQGEDRYTDLISKLDNITKAANEARQAQDALERMNSTND